MDHQEELDAFFEKWGGRTKAFELIESACLSSGGKFADELSELVSHNPQAKKIVTEIVEITAKGGQFGGSVVPTFVGTPATHGTSTSDDFFKAKSPEYLVSAEFTHDNEAAARNEEDGWPDDGRDIGDA